MTPDPNMAPVEVHPRDSHMDAAGWELWNFLTNWQSTNRCHGYDYVVLFHDMQREELVAGFRHTRTDPIIEELYEYVRQWREKWQPTRIEYVWVLQQVQNNEYRAIGARERATIDAAAKPTGG